MPATPEQSSEPSEPVIEEVKTKEVETVELAETADKPVIQPNSITDNTKIADLTLGDLKAILSDLLDKAVTELKQHLATPAHVETAPADSQMHTSEILAKPAEPPRKLSLDELFQDDKPATQSPTRGTDSGS